MIAPVIHLQLGSLPDHVRTLSSTSLQKLSPECPRKPLPRTQISATDRYAARRDQVHHAENLTAEVGQTFAMLPSWP